MVSVSHALVRLGRGVAVAANHDFCPWANRYVDWLRQPLGWFLIAAFAAGLVGAGVAPQGWWVCGVLLAVTLLGVLWPWLALRSISAEAVFERTRCWEGEPTRVCLRVRNRWPWPVWGLLVEGGFVDDEAEREGQAATALARISGWSRTRFDFEFRPSRRGAYPRTPPRLATGFPFGLWMARRELRVNGAMLAWPRATTLQSLPLPDGREPSAVGALADRIGQDGDLVSTRAFRPGDSLRRIHWPQTARFEDQLIVCERQTPSRQRVVVGLDEPSLAVADQEIVDIAMRVMASLLRRLHAQPHQLTCVLEGQSRRLDASSVALQRTLDVLACYEPGRVEAGDDDSIRRDDVRRGELVFWITFAPAGRRPAGQSFRTAREIRLHRGPSPSRQEDPPAAAPWMAIDVSRNVERQLAAQWERRCHHDWRTR